MDSGGMNFGFSALEALRLRCKEILDQQEDSLAKFAVGPGFKNLLEEHKTSPSVSSTATCVLSLVATHRWKASKSETRELLHVLIGKNTSADLPPDNPFTTAWILEAATALQGQFSEELSKEDLEEVRRKENLLAEAVDDGNGGIDMQTKPSDNVARYPSSGYLTQLVMRTLRKRDKLTPSLAEKIRNWAWSELTRQLALIQANSKSQDPFAVVYLLMVVTSLTPRTTISPDQYSIQKSALNIFFRAQLSDGSWPLSRPLFHYPGYGNAYCYEFETLTQLLQLKELEDLMLEHLPTFRNTALFAVDSGYRLEPGVRAWASGHHAHIGQPESWATASVYNYFYVLDRLLAEAVRRELYHHLELPYPNPAPPRLQQSDFAKDLLDSVVRISDNDRSLKSLLWDSFVGPISLEAFGVKNGIPFNKTTPRSAIFFGPPGTSKTELSKEIARFIGWRFLSIDPSLLLRKGMEGIQAEANSIFRILDQTEGLVILFDEFDELVRERASGTELPFSRLLTTAMLPKLAALHKRGTIVFIIATNNISQFDLAIRRPGRFDRLFQIMPPIFEAKMDKQNWIGLVNFNIREKLSSLGVEIDQKIRQELSDLTFSECEAFARGLSEVQSLQTATSLLDSTWNRCTLRAPITEDESENWSQRCDEERSFNRIN